jgi:hypothetical protein
MLGELAGSDPDSRMCRRPRLLRTPAGKTFPPKDAMAHKQFRRRQGMVEVGAVKVLLATCPRALLRSTLTAPTSTKNAPLGNCL